MKPCTLQQEFKTKVAGQIKKNYETIDVIEVAIYPTSYKTNLVLITGDLNYTKAELVGLTRFRGFEHKEKYLLIDAQGRKYTVEDMDRQARLTSLELKEVF